MTVDWLVSDPNRADSLHRQQEIRRVMELTRAREVDRAGGRRRRLFARPRPRVRRHRK